jgi:hypothetical protein
MILLNNAENPALDALDVRWVVSDTALASRSLGASKIIDNCFVYERNAGDTAKLDGSYFAPGWRNEKYQPQSFRLGAFISLAALFACAAAFGTSFGVRSKNL